MKKIINKDVSIPYNQFCREKVKEALLRDLVIDLEVCKLEGLDHKQYITELKQIIDETYKRICER